ncbi:hypothetical protein RB614_25800 [Phytohabitans sp. ZYX-F-186]|uniref:Uncharacterized protein n=1 Tax=Phytohabitans maris TaxID=3071409 RepID=A0ABU0ZNJ6_9ACTN|nr:hypothetical protein [Phytohabitans sp. ZYX-F-186]MDQ7907944.1 hypothetical protein [Phytohabitans sp. ZYX-F-186]
MLYDEPVARRGMRRAEKIGIWLGVVTLVVTTAVAIGAWRWPRDTQGPAQPRRPDGAAPGPSTGQPAPAPTTAAPTPAGPAATYLADLPPQSGGGNLVTLPRALKGQAGYDHPIVVQCPTNQSDDKVRTVTYLLRGRYLDLAATVRPYYTGQPDSRTYVTAVSGVKERDDTLTRRTAGTQFTATMATPGRLTAAVDGVEELTIQVQCESPEGVVVLADASLTPAG